MTHFSILPLYTAISILALATLIALASLVKFDSVLLKLVALEVLTNILLAGVALWALVFAKPVFIDLCLTLALIMFLGVVAYFQHLSDDDKETSQ
ncbi:MAG: cation:proton antiporter [Legionellales bacterium]|nr:cation:proton antiporter [Legionellales bacterium]|tara:strand:+ start:45767 stop:46051 length:285 start_codon:yes stop_codon:yes gene_type:complete